MFTVFNRMGQTKLEIGSGCLKRPWNIDVIDEDHYIVSDPGVNSLKIFDIRQPQKINKTIDLGPTILEPFGLCVEKSTKDIFVSDKGAGCIYIFDKDGSIKTSVKPEFQLIWPQYVTITNDDNILVTDYVNHKVFEYDLKGNQMFELGSEGSLDEQFLGPQGLAVDKHGYIFVADSANNRVKVLDENGNFIKNILTEKDSLERPQSLEIDRSGYIVVCEYGGCVKLFEYLN